MVESDEEDFVFFGTPIEREEDVTSRKKKSVAEAAGQLRAVAPWQQEVRDDEGRRRFHGAFTGGYSAGYYNTVGSKEGWTPQTFTSSRKNRAETKEQSIDYFLDDDEKAEMDRRTLGTSALFDTFGFTAAEVARKQADKEQKNRPSAIPGPVPDEIVLPATNSIGLKLLSKMGWRQGHSIKDSRTNLMHDARREARKAFLALSSDDTTPPVQFEPNVIDNGPIEQSTDDVERTPKSTPVFVLNPKQDMHGLGYDPFKHAPEFRERKRQRVSGNRELGNRGAFHVKEDLFAFKSGKIAPGFGIGALEELGAEDEDIYASGYDFEETYVQDVEEPSTVDKDIKLIKSKDEQGVLHGFKVASNPDFQTERFNPPVIPSDFKPHHVFPVAVETGNKLAGPPPPEVPQPEDKNLKLLIDGFATLVTRCGKLFEDLSREKNKTNPLFSFLSGGNGHDYYARRLWEEQQKRTDQPKQTLDIKSAPSVQKMTAESRGRILGEKPLERSYKDASTSADAVHLQFNLSDTFTKPASLNDAPEVVKPFKADPSKQERFEQFLKEKYQGGLRSTESGGNSKMSESARARERLDFEAAAELIEKGKHGAATALSATKQFVEPANLEFTSGGLEGAKVSKTGEQSKMYPKREEYQWRPAPILCKRFDIADPYMGKPPPVPRARGRIDSLLFTADFVKATKADVATSKHTSLPSPPEPDKEEVPNPETEIKIDTNLERPVDLYKAIFSDDSDDEGEGGGSSVNETPDLEKKTEVANTTLNRLIAGDFLESLGKELGLEVPPETLIVKEKENIPTPVGEPLKGGPSNGIEQRQSRSSGSVSSEDRKQSRRRRKRSVSPSEDERSRIRSRRRRSLSSSDSSDEERSRGKSRRRKHSKNYRDRSRRSSPRRGYGKEGSEDRKSSGRRREERDLRRKYRD